MHRPSYCSPRNQNQNQSYTFDLKVNVDFTNGHVKLQIPPTHPISTKMHGHPKLPISYANSAQMNSQFHLFLPQGQMKGSSSTNPELEYSLRSSLYQLQHSIEAVECVICNKTVHKNDFALHIQQHKNRNRKTKMETIEYTFQNPTNDLSIRNPNSSQQIIELGHQILQNPYIASQSFHRSQQIELSNSSRSIYQNSSPNIHSFHNQSFVPYGQNIFHQPSYQNISQSSNHTMNKLQKNNDQYQNYRFFQNVQNNHSLNLHRIDSVIIRPNLKKQQTIQSQVNFGNKYENQSLWNYSESSIHSRNSFFSQPEEGKQMIEVSRSNQSKPISQMSVDAQMGHSQPEKIRSINKTKQISNKKMTQSIYSNRTNRAKIPINYLAREQFISNSTHSSAFNKIKSDF